MRENLRFLVHAGLLPDYAKQIHTYLVSNPESAPQLGTVLPAVGRKLNAVLVGVSRRKDPSLALRFAAKDAEDLAVALRRQQGGLYQQVNLRVLTDAAATREALLNSLLWMARETTEFDTSVLFLVGKGVSDKD